eukprot:2812019-Pleurochrysis_carterae.AAC.1
MRANGLTVRHWLGLGWGSWQGLYAGWLTDVAEIFGRSRLSAAKELDSLGDTLVALGSIKQTRQKSVSAVTWRVCSLSIWASATALRACDEGARSETMLGTTAWAGAR